MLTDEEKAFRWSLDDSVLTLDAWYRSSKGQCGCIASSGPGKEWIVTIDDHGWIRVYDGLDVDDDGRSRLIHEASPRDIRRLRRQPHLLR